MRETMRRRSGFGRFRLPLAPSFVAVLAFVASSTTTAAAAAARRGGAAGVVPPAFASSYPLDRVIFGRRRRPSGRVLLATSSPLSSSAATPLRGGGASGGDDGVGSGFSGLPRSSLSSVAVEGSVESFAGAAGVRSSLEEEEEEEEKKPPASSSSSSSRSTIIADDPDFVRSLPDKRSYRAITLRSNSLLCLLVSDPNTDVEAGSVHLRTGHFDDPANRAGLAHFHEHMLFLGTEKYPGEDEYEKFLGRNGGSSNAYTDMEDTNYYFSVAPLDHDDDENEEEDDDLGERMEKKDDAEKDIDEGGVSNALSGALDRFAQFFVSPLFKEEMVEREMRAIDSEHLNSVTSDAWRGYSLLKSGSDPGHPFHKFGCGNYGTLSDGGDVKGTSASATGGSSPRPNLIRFWEDHYAAHNMRLCVVGRASLDELQEVVEETFKDVRPGPPIRRDGEEESVKKNEKVIDGKVNDAEAGSSSSSPKPFFPTENNNVHRPASSMSSPAFPPSRLGLLREVVPVIESRSIKLSFGFPPLDDPILKQGGRPHRAISHLLGHESPGSLHDVLNEEGYINGLSSGVGVDCSDFSLFTLTLSLTPRGMRHRSRVLDLVFQWISLIRSTVEGTTTADGDGSSSSSVPPTMHQYHDELRRISETNFRYRENGDPTDFASHASGALFDYEPSEILIGATKYGEYDPIVAKELSKRLDPKNALITVVSPDFEREDEEFSTSASELEEGNEEFTARDAEWRTERWYGAKHRERRIPDRFVSRWSSSMETTGEGRAGGTPIVVDERLRLPALNQFIPSDFSLRCDDEEEEEEIVVEGAGQKKRDASDDDADVSPPSIRPAATTMTIGTEPPTVVVDRPGLRMWHKLDRTWRVPKLSIRMQLTSPNIYKSPRSMTLNRLYQRVLNDDLNSFVYDAGMAGCNYRVTCVPTGYRISVSGYSEKLPLLLDVVTTRMLSLVAEMKEGPEAHPGLSAKFDKALHNLLRETKNYRLDSPYEVASYNSRMAMEEHVWHVDDYIDEMEGPYAEQEPLTMEECARAAEECLLGRVKAEALCIGNINRTQTLRVADTIANHFLRESRPLSEDETPSSRSYRLPTREEAVRIFGPDVANASIPTIVEELAFGDEEDNSAAQVIYQIGCEHELGYEGVATLELLSHISYNSAFGRLRTKEQLGYIVGTSSRRTAGGAWSLSVVVQSGVADPSFLEGRIESWLASFRDEIESMPEGRIAMEANAVAAQLTERDSKLSDEIGRFWGEILSVETKGSKTRSPAFDRLERLADELTIDEVDDGDATVTATLVDRDGEPRPPRTAALLKKRLIELFDERLAADAPERRALSTRVYGRKFGEAYEANRGKPGVLSTYDDVRHVKRYLSTWPNAPYWA